MSDMDVRARLVVDDSSTSELNRIAGGHRKVADEASHAQEQSRFLESTLANFAALELHSIVDSVKELGYSFVEAASAGQQADQAVGALISAVQGRGWQDAHQEAEQLGDELDVISLKSHVVGDDLGRAFQKVLEITGATEEGVEKATDQVGQMAPIANVLGKSVEQIAGEFAMMGEGILKTKSQMFQILNPTGIFGENVKKASAGWAALTEEERGKRLAYALDQVASKAAEAEPTFRDMLATMHNIWDITKEKLGEPVIHALVPEMKKFGDELEAGLPSIEAFGKMMAVDVKAWVQEASESLQEGFDYIKTHGHEIHDVITKAVNEVKAVVGWILEHKDELAIAFGAKSALSLAGGAAKMVGESGAFGAASKGIGGLYRAGAGEGPVLSEGVLDKLFGGRVQKAGSMGATLATGLQGGGALGGIALVGAAAVAATAWAAAGVQLGKLQQELVTEERQEYNAIADAMKRMTTDTVTWAGSSTEELDRLRAKLLEAARRMDGDVAAAAALANAIERAAPAHDANMKYAKDLEAMGKSFDVITRLNDDAVNKANGAKAMNAAEQERQRFLTEGTGGNIVNQFAAGFENLRAAHDNAAMNYVANLLANSKNLTSAFLASAQLTDEGWGALADSIEAGGSQFADIAKMFRDQIGGAQQNKKLAVNQNFNFGGSSFKIQQDFRDQDPDRVAVQFKRDLLKPISNRLQANTGIG